MAAVVRNRFYGAVALALTALVLVAFARTYYLREWFTVPPITTLLHLHSIAFTAWFVLFIIQTRLIARQNYRTHMQFVFVPLFGIASFAALVTAAALLRKSASLHKRLMTLAMISVLGPPVARLINLTQNTEHFLAIQMAVPAALIIWCLVSDWLKYRVVHPVYALGGTLMVLSWPLRAWFARTPAWESVGQWMAGM